MTSAVTEIQVMDRTDLVVAWSDLFGTPVPKRLSSPFLRRFLAYELQTRSSGGLPRGFVAKIDKAARQDPRSNCPALKPGGRLIREWNGVTHAVDVVESGFIWNGERYASLSPIARTITGARWSGPRFFGLRR